MRIDETSNESSTIPVLRDGVNSFSSGVNGMNLSSNAMERHPIDRMQRACDSSMNNLDLDSVRRLYGSGLAMRLVTERKLAKDAVRRLPGLPDSRTMLEVVTGDDLSIDFGDFLGVAGNRVDMPFAHGPHNAMEARLGI